MSSSSYRRFHLAYLLLSLSAFFALTLRAQKVSTRAAIHGRVVDLQTGEPIGKASLG